MVHTNGHLLCAIDVETTGSDPLLNEIFQLAVLPLDFDLQPLRSVQPVNLLITPQSPGTIDPKALKITRTRLADLMNYSIDPFHAMELFEDWFFALNLPVTTMGHKKIMPLWSNGDFDKKFLQAFFGEELYNTFFYFHERDTQHLALAINDRYFFHGEKIPFPKVGLGYLAKCFGIVQDNPHDALADCVTTMEVYRELTRMYMPVNAGASRSRSPDDEP